MGDPSLGELCSRLAKLERSVLRWRLVALVGLGIATALAVAGANRVTGVVRARRLAIVDSDGKEVITLGSDPNMARLAFRDPATEEVRMVLVHQAGRGSSLSMYDQRGKNRLNLLASHHGGTMIGLKDEDEKVRLNLVVPAFSGGAINILDPDGKDLFTAP